MSLDANELYYKMLNAGCDWADKQSAANILEDTRSSVLAKLMMRSDASSVAAREMEAKASEDYQDHVKKTQSAMAEALKAKVNYEAIKVWVELKRTEAANDRAAMKLV